MRSCSFCFETVEMKLASKERIDQYYSNISGFIKIPRSRNQIFECSNCGSLLSNCVVPGCDHMALLENKPMMYCAIHSGLLRTFEDATIQVDNIEDYKDIFETKRINVEKFINMGVVAIGSGAIIGPLAYFAAPAIGGGIGTTLAPWLIGKDLAGAAATNYGLALLGLGAKAAGGYGIVGGVTVIAASGTALGAAQGARISNSYYQSLSDFRITKLKDGTGTPIIFSEGFLSDRKHVNNDSWLIGIIGKYPSSPIYRLDFDSKNLYKLGEALAVEVSGNQLLQLIKMASKKGCQK